MASPAGNSVTIDKAYFEALLRRAEFYTAGDHDTVTISRAEYEFLVRSISEYRSLCNALIRGGVTQEVLQILTKGGDNDDQQTEEESGRDCTFDKPQHIPVQLSAPDNTPGFDHSPVPSCFDSHPLRGQEVSQTRDSYSPEEDHDEDQYPRVKTDREETRTDRSLPRDTKRTIHITNLASQMPMRDLINVIRGGRILEAYFRKDHSVIVSFVEGAEEFVRYARKENICVNGRPIHVKWAERQFRLAPHVANKLANGATRNLVIRRGTKKHTEEGIREDMEHIENLIILDIDVRGEDIFLSTNSVHQAMYARTCMMSRAAYKGLRIEWCPDPCGATLPKSKVPRHRNHRFQTAVVDPVSSVVNRYTLLSLDASSSDSGKEKQADQNFPAYGVGLSSNWAESVTA
ncbi:hypothetical protein EJ05DRAFT_497846 [Pseudovirgaria hyperparasitica]|uniref:RRM domain-containing protein n=1 Tax=Pseudovirgaria hyperparasitica TaxID=470096 RepID=A0A6A6WEZ4_9PEZI|nr:uncharacterized protein EJ05DRAFT_497846 [Pseudovirgaria hyperparasitica]KAF2761293.1 hypothetical protein EJ05DRAFT_497846 [Pseudovirgaria hyperparasitica]